jgi:uncharacterized protein (TIGR03067 family)
MLLAKLKLTTAALLTVVAVGGAASGWSYRALAATGEQIRQQDAPPQVTHDDEQKPDHVAAEKERLQGTWVPIGALFQGKKQDPEEAGLQQWKLVFDGDKVTIPDNRTMHYVLDPSVKPKIMDLFGKNREPIILAIYEWDGEKLKFSFKKARGQLTEADRPTDFDTAKNKSILIVYKRRNGA